MKSSLDKLFEAQRANSSKIVIGDGTITRSIDGSEFEKMFGVKYTPRSVFDPRLPGLIERKKKIFLETIQTEADYFTRFSHKQMKKRIKNAFQENQFCELLLPSERRYLYGEQISDGNTAPIVICSVKEALKDETYAAAGFGLFAEKDLVKGQFLGEAAGHIRRVSASEPVNLSYAYTYSNKAGGFVEINDSLKMGNALRFLNHSKESNVEVLGVNLDNHYIMFVIATQNIKEGEQLLLDYGDAYWQEKELIKF